MAAADVQGPIIAGNEKTAASIHRPSVPVHVTTSNSQAYIHACALSSQKASRNDPLTRLFQGEKFPALPDEETYTDEDGKLQPTPSAVRKRLSALTDEQIEAMIYDSCILRTTRYVGAGGFVVEAGNFAATTVWEPAFAPKSKDFTPDASKMLPLRDNCPIFKSFLTQIEQIKIKHLYPVIWKAQQSAHEFSIVDDWTAKVLSGVTEQQKKMLYWHLTLTARNPAVQPAVPGAVRAVIEPFVQKWVHDAGMPAVWLEAGSPHARNIYGYFGFRVVGEVIVGHDEAGNGGISTWCMIYTKDHV